MNLEKPQEPLTHYPAFSRLLAVMFAPLALAGCLVTTPIETEDKRVFLQSLRASINLDEGKQVASEPQTGRAIEFGFTQARGGGNQSLASVSYPIVLGNTTFTGPQQLRNDFDFYIADVSWRWRKFFWERSLGLELLAGTGVSSLRLDVSSPAQRASERFNTLGPQGGVGLIWRLSQGNSLQARARVFVSIAQADQAEYAMARGELFYAKALREDLTLRAGYASWQVNGSQGSDNLSDFKLRFSGPALVLDWDFNANN